MFLMVSFLLPLGPNLPFYLRGVFWLLECSIITDVFSRFDASFPLKLEDVFQGQGWMINESQHPRCRVKLSSCAATAWSSCAEYASYIRYYNLFALHVFPGRTRLSWHDRLTINCCDGNKWQFCLWHDQFLIAEPGIIQLLIWWQGMA